ncbi:unnamed protein product [Vitrella brassicaformis CCMP3155]|uniref:Uncharacterized protein n=1 Tax=Vitrella brassicaformis (strain CCMP3155) TaxID=1169540 RepID=A0A0G4FZV6_VITBC|nr:unnamed protein product [Vitrella brassicaformis CCMP3155]|eukprot:CEM20633.1 unnamed protein product [Vitrella brassicaformis CCMP3155]
MKEYKELRAALKERPVAEEAFRQELRYYKRLMCLPPNVPRAVEELNGQYAEQFASLERRATEAENAIRTFMATMREVSKQPSGFPLPPKDEGDSPLAALAEWTRRLAADFATPQTSLPVSPPAVED